jgi:hypothetical protein
MKLTTFVVAALTALLAALVMVNGAYAAGWRTIAMAEDRYEGDFDIIFFFARGSSLNVKSLRASVSGPAMKVAVEVQCKRGESEASRKLTLRHTGGSKNYKLPVTVGGSGNRCEASFDVNADGDSGDTFKVVIQAQ